MQGQKWELPTIRRSGNMFVDWSIKTIHVTKLSSIESIRILSIRVHPNFTTLEKDDLKRTVPLKCDSFTKTREEYVLCEKMI